MTDMPDRIWVYESPDGFHVALENLDDWSEYTLVDSQNFDARWDAERNRRIIEAQQVSDTIGSPAPLWDVHGDELPDDVQQALERMKIQP